MSTVRLDVLLQGAQRAGRSFPAAEAAALICASVRLAESQGVSLRPQLLLLDDADGLVLDLTGPESPGIDSDPSLAPEVVSGATAPSDSKALVYAAGALAYQVYTGRPPPDPKAEPGRELDPFLSVIIGALRHDPRLRFPSLGDLRQALEAAVPPGSTLSPSEIVARLRAGSQRPMPTSHAPATRQPSDRVAPATSREAPAARDSVPLVPPPPRAAQHPDDARLLERLKAVTAEREQLTQKLLQQETALASQKRLLSRSASRRTVWLMVALAVGCNAALTIVATLALRKRPAPPANKNASPPVHVSPATAPVPSPVAGPGPAVAQQPAPAPSPPAPAPSPPAPAAAALPAPEVALAEHPALPAPPPSQVPAASASQLPVVPSEATDRTKKPDGPPRAIAIAPRESSPSRETSRPPSTRTRRTRHAPAAHNRSARQAEIDKGERALRKGQMDEALAAFQAALASDSSSPAAIRGIAMVHMSQGKEAEARREYERYLKLAPSAPDAARIRKVVANLGATQ